MKKVITLVMALLLIFTLSACSKDDNSEPKGGSDNTKKDFTILDVAKSKRVSDLEIIDMKMSKKVYKPGETISVTVTYKGTPEGSAWIGIIPANVEHGDEYLNDEHDIDYRYLCEYKSNEEIVFDITLEEGSYTMRINETDDGGPELAWTDFIVKNGSSSSDTSVDNDNSSDSSETNNNNNNTANNNTVDVIEGSYREALENEWKNAPAKGYVYTIHIDDEDVIDILGLASAVYSVNLDATHIGDTMYGAYFGEFEFSSSTDLGGLDEIAGALGGDMELTDGDLWFANNKFVFSLDKFNNNEEEEFTSAISSGSEYEAMSDEEKAMMDSLLGEVYVNKQEDFETTSSASALWWDFDMPMTDGDLGAELNMSLYGGLVNGYAQSDSSGMDAQATVSSIVGTFHESTSLRDKFKQRYGDSEDFNYPMPYTIKVYPGNEVIMTFYSLDGSPITIKCYGTIEKVPVKDVKNLPNA